MLPVEVLEICHSHKMAVVVAVPLVPAVPVMIGRTQNGLVLVEMEETYIKVEPVTEMKGVETEVKVLTV